MKYITTIEKIGPRKYEVHFETNYICVGFTYKTKREAVKQLNIDIDEWNKYNAFKIDKYKYGRGK